MLRLGLGLLLATATAALAHPPPAPEERPSYDVTIVEWSTWLRAARAGGNPDVRTAQLGVAYRAPWDLFGRQPRGSRYVIGAGLVATATQNRHDPRDWSATIGIELEPVGAIRYLLGIRSWH